MEKTLKIKYVTPEVVDFKWMESMGECFATGSGDLLNCSSNGINAGTVCMSNGISAGVGCTAGSGN